MLRLKLTALLLMTIPVVLQAQVTDFPRLLQPEINFHHLQLTLELNPDDETLKGVAAWQFSSSDTDGIEIKFNAIRTEVHNVLINERDADFFMSGDTLVISPLSDIRADTRHKLEIIYRSEISFGLNQIASGAFRSSMLPGAAANLFPVVLSPELQLPIDIRMIVPADWQGVSNGIKTANILLPEGRRLYHWRTAAPAPVTQIGLAAGQMNVSQLSIGNTAVNFFAEHGDIEDSERETIMRDIQRIVEAAQEVTGRPLPFESMNFVYIQDMKWELAPYGHAFAYLSPTSGTIRTQILRAVTHQYAGTALRSATIADNDHILALQAILAHKIASRVEISPREIQSDNPFLWEGESWIRLSEVYWNYALTLTHPRNRDLIKDEFKEYISELEQHFSTLIALEPGVYTWSDWVSEASIDDTILPMRVEYSNLPQIEQYTVIYDFDEVNGRYELELVPHASYPHRYLSLIIRHFTDGTLSDMTILASNMGDRIHLSTSGYVENMYIFNEDPLLSFTEIKPAAFWLYQLRRDGDAQRRIESAKGFGRVQNDPDVQLILQDLIRNEPDPVVKAELVSSLSEIVRGSFGTNQRFVDLLRDDSRLVRFAALRALRNYSGNEAVQQQVFRIISQSQDIEYVNKAIEVYKYIVDEREFYSVARSLLHEDREDLHFTATIIPLIVQTQQGVIFAPNLMDYLDKKHTFTLRRLTFEALAPLSIESEYWAEILPDLLIDADPRIRYMALDLISALPASNRDEIIQNRLYNEYDVRVLNKVQSMLP